ncbi:hypothetical protein [Kitasatospora sp. NPDC098663]|uniref:hypothetical protein n=1 Tax=Kitasatospora sp. NPDC098663 TaxID=3364096 RepID=UPI003824B690
MATAPAHIEALRYTHLDIVLLAADLTATRTAGEAPHPAGTALRDAAFALTEADRHLLTVTRNLWRDNVTGDTYTADPGLHHRSLRQAERVLDRAADDLHRAAERAERPSRSTLRTAAARLRSAATRRPAAGGAVVEVSRFDNPAVSTAPRKTR